MELSQGFAKILSSLPDNDFPPPCSLVKNENVLIVKHEYYLVPDKPTDKERSANTRQFQVNVPAAAGRKVPPQHLVRPREKSWTLLLHGVYLKSKDEALQALQKS